MLGTLFFNLLALEVPHQIIVYNSIMPIFQLLLSGNYFLRNIKPDAPCNYVKHLSKRSLIRYTCS